MSEQYNYQAIVFFSASNLCDASLDTSTVVGISVAMTFILSFSLGGLVTAIIICGCYIPRRFSSKTTNTAYDTVGDNNKTIELEINSAYGTGK